jgi:lipopolysaccharide biosynthesis glycosyltransferase
MINHKQNSPDTTRRPIVVSLACDDNYANLAATSLMSLLANLPPDTLCTAYICTFGLNNTNTSTLKAFEHEYNVKVEILTFSEDRYKKMPSGRWTTSMYLRYELATALPDRNRILYLDCDTLVRTDVTPLFELDLQGYPLGAARDYADLCEGRFQDHKKRLNINQDQPYFNSGVLLFDLQNWRDNDLTSKVFACLVENRDRIHFPDQDVLNLIFGDNVFWLDQSWNLQLPMILTQKQHPWWRPEIRQAIETPAVLHFTGDIKPWNEKRYLPYQHEFLYYLYKIKKPDSLRTLTNKTARALDYCLFKGKIELQKLKRTVKSLLRIPRVE